METAPTSIAHGAPPQPEPQRRTRVPGPRAKAAAAAQLAFLARLTQDVQDTATPIGAFRAALPLAPTRHTKSSSERGRSFRERQQRNEDALERTVVQLTREVARLEVQRAAWETRCLNRRASPTGSLVQLTCEYHRLFAHGIDSEPSVVDAMHAYEGIGAGERRYGTVLVQEAFLRRWIDETAIVGNMVGPEASIVQWRRYGQSLEGLTLEGTRIELSESSHPALEDDNEETVVSVTVHFRVHGRLSLQTFAMLFPHVVGNRALLDRMVGVKVTYPASRRLQFTRDGRIAVETVDVDFVAGLQSAGISLTDVATLLQGSAVTRDSMIVEVEPPAHAEPLPPTSNRSSWDTTTAA